MLPSFAPQPDWPDEALPLYHPLLAHLWPDKLPPGCSLLLLPPTPPASDPILPWADPALKERDRFFSNVSAPARYLLSSLS